MSRVALVTGGARGIGFGISSALAGDGWSLAICGVREEEAAAESLDRLRSLGSEVLYVQADVGNGTARQELVDAVRERFGRLDALVNNAGIAPRERKDILDATPESYDQVMGTNLKGPYFLTQLAANWMLEQKRADEAYRGSIVFVTSISSTVASPNRGEYCISKAGLSMACRLWAVRLAEFGIPVYEVRPGIIRTDMTAGVKEKYDRLIAEGLIPQARWGEAEDVGRAVGMLLRGDLPYSTGQVIMVEGGMTLDRL